MSPGLDVNELVWEAAVAAIWDRLDVEIVQEQAIWWSCYEPSRTLWWSTQYREDPS